jgi:RNA polymerase sigma-70 factor (ECF subfamily)
MQQQSDDKTILGRVAKGDESALKILYERHYESLVAFAQVWLGDPSEAADIVHETMLDVWRSAGKFKGNSTVKTWMFSIARNKSVDRNRKSSRSVLQEVDPNIEDDAASPQDMTQAFQDAAKLRACIDVLTPSHRSAIHLAFYEDLTYREIAEMEDKPVGTIKTRIMHAKNLLLRCVQSS